MTNKERKLGKTGMGAVMASTSVGERVRALLVMDNTRYGGNAAGDGTARKDESSRGHSGVRRVGSRGLRTKRSQPPRPDFSTPR